MINTAVILLTTILGLIASLLITPQIGKYMRGIGKVGNDVHKKDKPEIPESGGIGFMVLFLLILLIGVIISADNPLLQGRLAVSLIILTLVTIVGLYDDFRGLSAKMKPLILVIIAVPVILFRDLADPTPALPFVGPTQLTIVYWGLAIFVIAVPSNASNMLDVMNGVMSFSGILILGTAFLTTFIIELPEEAVLYIRFVSLSMIGVLLGFWWYNKYPASIFAGDTGSLGVGAVIGLVAVYGQIEFVLVVALLVHIMNSFSIISSVGGLRERREMKERPVIVDDGLISASTHLSAPITMVRLMVARKPLPENEVIKKILFLVFYCCLLALVTAYLIQVSL